MAKILYEVKQNLNQYSLAYGKWFARVKALETLNTRKLANHISEHGSIYTPDVVYGVLENMKALHIRFLPEQATEENISSREFIKKAEFVNVDSLLKNEEENGSGSDSNQ